MIYLENININKLDKFDDFLNKYNKTGYISKKSMDTLDQLGLNKDNFNKLNANIDIARIFFKNQNFEILRELLYDITDDYPIAFSTYNNVEEEQIYYYCNLKIEASSYKKIYGGPEVGLSLRYVESDYVSNINIIKNIFKLIESEKNTKTLKYSDTINKFTPRKNSKEKAGGRYGDKYFFDQNIKSNYFKEIKIIPMLNLIIYFKVDNNCTWLGSNYEENREILKTIKNNLTEYIIPRYLDIIECPYDFKISDFYINQNGFNSGYTEIKISLDI